MNAVLAILGVFALAALAPGLQRVTRAWTGWVLATVVGALAVGFARRVPDVTQGDAVATRVPWVPFLDVALAFRLDGLSLLFTLLVLGIGALILVYAGGYMKGDPHLGRFYATLLAFMGAMLGLVLADDVIALFVFWELTSLTSFLLVGWKNEDPLARYAARQALLVTAGGGLLLLAGLVLLVLVTGASTFSGMQASGVNVQAHALYLPILLLVAAGAFTKSAQFPFHFWLPGAMAAPTPVSAYLHSATMVKAGVYLLARTFTLLGGTPEWTTLLTVAGAATMLLGAYLAVKQRDLKLVLAYSTVSALGTLTLLIGLGSDVAMEAAVVFLIAHALYKGALFMVAGAVDHQTGTRDLDVLHGLRKAMPVTALAGAIAAFSLAGLAPLFSFIGKELLLEALLVAPVARSILIAATSIASMFLVGVALVIGIRPFVGSPEPTPRLAREAPPALLVGPLMLATTSLVLGVFPNALESSIVSSTVTAILAEPVPVKLALWHGFTPALLISLVTLVGGFAIYFEWVSLHRLQSVLQPLLERGPARWYAATLSGTESVSRFVTRTVQHGSLRGYVATIAGVTATLGAVALVRGGGVDLWQGWGAVAVHEVLVAILMVAAAGVAVTARTVLASVAALGVLGYGVAMTFILLNAPDLAMTQALVETLVVLLFILALRGHMPGPARARRVSTRALTGAVAAALGVVTTVLVLAVQAAPAPASRVSEAQAALSYVVAHGRNVVNVILVDFRALDTLGEITVLGIAAIGVLALLRLKPQDGGDDA